jgi:hypothetical protein
MRAAVTVVVAVLAGGCELRDEPVRMEPRAAAWPVPTLDAADDRRGPTQSAAVAGMEYVEGYESAARRAAAAGMPLLLVFRAGWCRHSAAAARGPLAADEIVARSRRFVCATVDADRDAATCRAFAVTGFPTVILVDARGDERFRTTGSAAAGLAAAMDAMAGGGSSDSGSVAAGTPAPAAVGNVVR